MIPTSSTPRDRDVSRAGAAVPEDWVAALAFPGPEQDEAIRRLHVLMVRAARHQVHRMRGLLAHRGDDFCDELAQTAADEALTTLLHKLHTFEGRSRFTTWAYKFAVLQAATEVRRQAWAGREVRLDDADLWCDPGPSPAAQAEGADLVVAVHAAMRDALTPYQRKIAIALLVDDVPIDVLAERLGTTRGALYKALHQARGRLRERLRRDGYLDAPTTDGGTR